MKVYVKKHSFQWTANHSCYAVKLKETSTLCYQIMIKTVTKLVDALLPITTESEFAFGFARAIITHKRTHKYAMTMVAEPYAIFSQGKYSILPSYLGTSYEEGPMIS